MRLEEDGDVVDFRRETASRIAENDRVQQSLIADGDVAKAGRTYGTSLILKPSLVRGIQQQHEICLLFGQ